MVRNLFILRHGEAKSAFKWADHERPLTDSGIETVAILRERLKKFNPAPELIISSDAKRTTQTTQVLTKGADWKPKIVFTPALYNASLKKILNVLTEMDKAHSSVVLVGHNPGLSELSAYLLGLNFMSLFPGQMIACELVLEDWAALSGNTATLIEI